MSQAKAEFARLEAQVHAVNRAMAQSVLIPKGVNPGAYSQMTQQMKVNSRVYRDAAASTGLFEVQQLRVNSATEEYTRLLEKQKLSFRDWTKQRKLANSAYREQLALQSMTVRRLPGTVGGKQMLDITIPNEVHKDLDTLGNRFGWVREQVKSASTQMVNWGKNTQWAGRQLMVGFTMPVLAFGAATGVLAYQIDKQMTRIQKVYDTTADQTSNRVKDMQAVEAELAKVRSDSMNTALRAAKEYGSAASDTLSIQAELAATGLAGARLQGATNEVMRISTLGEMEHADALNATISLQSVFKQSNEELAESFNYMNAVENATSLQLKDFAAAIPIAAAPIKMMGGDVQTLGVLLTAMRERGIEATEGANAIKAAMQRLYRPSQKIQEEFQKITGTSILEVRDRNKGDIVKMLQDIGEAAEGLNRQEKIQAFAGLFGTYQVTRISALVEGLGDLENGVGQVSDAFALGKQTPKDWADAADREIDRLQNSVSQKFKSSVETIKIQLAEMGEPFLNIAASVINAVSKVIEYFNSLPDSMKNFMAGSAVFMALVGPVVMLIGLFANFTGNMLKFGVALTGVLTRFELLNKESAAARLAAGLASEGFVNEASAVSKLTAELQRLALAQVAAARAANQIPPYFSNGILNPQLGTYVDANGRKRNAQGQFTSQNIIKTPAQPFLNGKIPGMPQSILLPQEAWTPNQSATSAQKVGSNMNGWVTSSGKTAQNVKKTSGFMEKAAVSSGVFATAMAASYISSNKTVDKVAQIAMMTALLGPAMWSVVKALGSATAISALGIVMGKVVAGWRMASIHATLVANGTIRTGAAMAALTNPVGLLVLGLTAAATASYFIGKNIDKAANRVENLTSNAKPMAEILDYTYTEPGTIEPGSPAEHFDKVQETANAYGDVVAKIRSAKDEQDKFNAAMELGLEVINTGGTQAQAKEAVGLALEAAEDKATAKRIMLRFGARLELDNNQIVYNQARESVARSVDEALKVVNDKGFWETARDAITFSGEDTIPEEAVKWFETAGQRGRQAYEAGLASGHGSQPYLVMIEQDLAAIDKKIAETEGMERKRFEDARRNYIRQQVLATGTEEAANGLSDEWMNQANALNVLDKTLVSVSQKQRYDFLKKLHDNGKATLAQFIQLQRLYIRLHGGQEKNNQATEEGAKFTEEWGNLLARGVSMVASYPAIAHAAAQAQKVLNREMAAAKEVNWVDVYREGMEKTQDEISDIASENFNEKMDEALEAYSDKQQKRLDDLSKQHERENDRFASRWERRTEAVSNSYDQRVDAINQAVEAEQKAEDIRQRIFDAEMQRIQRLAEMANTNIDFNVALNTGELDEAAKIRNDMQAKEAEWALGDAADAGNRASQRRQDALNDRADNLEDARDKRLEHLEQIENAEKKALERSQEREKKALDREVENNIKAQELIWESRKRNMDRAIELFRNYVPKNEADLKRHISSVSSKYSDFNDNVQRKFDGTAVRIGHMLTSNVKDSSRAVRDDIRWDGIGNKIAADMIHGAFGMTTQQFRNWLVTGKWPKSAKPPTAKDLARMNGTGQYSANDTRKGGDQGALVYHTGGIAGKDKGGYAGIRPGHRDEVNATLLRGEGVLNRDAMSAIGESRFRALNSGNLDGLNRPTNRKAGMGGIGMGIAGMMGAMMFAAIRNTIQQSAITGATKMLSTQAAAGRFTAGKAGAYGDVAFDAEQLANAQTIANVGKNMGMSSRDIQIGIMTAITESMLRNVRYGDRDSQGLFQQRPSQGWGTVAQVTDPNYAATKFFQSLKQVGNRSAMSPWAAAQAVQRSAYADGSNYEKYWDEAIAIFSGFGADSIVQGKGGWNLPIAGRKVGNSHAPGPGTDIAVPRGTAVRAVYDGKVITSKDIPGPLASDRFNGDGPYGSYGRYVMLRHDLAGGPHYSLYAHLNNRLAQTGQTVKGGTVIGRSGNTGNSSGPHLHFEVGAGLSANSAAYPGTFLSARGLPALKKGGDIKWDNTIANLHKDERVLTAPLTKKLDQGIDNFANGGNAEYNLHMHVNGESVNVDELVNKTMVALDRLERRRPQSRSGK